MTADPDDPAESPASLDPSDWDAFRELAHTALDDAIDYIRRVRGRPVWQPVPESVKAELAEPLPVEPQGIASVYRDFRARVFPYSVGNVHPRFFGWVHGAGLTSGIVAEMMAAAMDANCGGRDHVGLYVERAVIEWCKSVFGFPDGSSGLLLTGTSMATLTGLAVARNARSLGEMRFGGLQGHPKRLVAYTSSEAHASVTKAMEVLGHGRDALRRIRVQDDFRMDPDALREAIAEDRAAGREPFCVVGTAGTVNTGAIDDLEQLGAICRDEGLWFHVDGAFGALAILSDELRPRLRGIERADSLAFDFHKWMHVQYDAGCLLVRDGEQQRKTFSIQPAYLRRAGGGLAAGGDWPCDLGPEQSRGFRALKLWFALKEHGVEAFARSITANCRQAEYLGDLVRRSPDMQLMSSPSLSVVCFRFLPPGWDAESVDRLNEGVVVDLQESGVAAPSATWVQGAVAIRVNITNHRTSNEDLDILMRAIADVAAKRIAADERAQTP
ncbi:MAG: aminotransferase class V-fold PLP-dependent enzyme [Thermoanaerobaculia bacterium]